MKHIRWLSFLFMLLALVGSLPVIAQDQTAEIDFVFNGTELQKLENSQIVQTWTMPVSLETQQTVAALKARAQIDDPEVRFVFDHDRMYHLRGNQVVDLWLLRAGRWVAAPTLVVNYTYDGRQLRRVVNGAIQQAWTLPNGLETQQLVGILQVEANKIVAARMFQTLQGDQANEPASTLTAEGITLHSLPVDKVPDMSWYTPDIAEGFDRVLVAPDTDPVVLATEDLVVTRHPAGNRAADVLGVPPIPEGETGTLYDVYGFKEGKITDLWLGYDLPTLIHTNH